MTDGTSTEEEALEREDSATSGHFRYIVWNYTTPKARPISYGVGDFKTVQQDPGHTRITWTYSFKLKSDTFPGEFGALGRWLFKVDFLERDYAAMMKGVLRGYQEGAEQMSPVSSVAPVTGKPRFPRYFRVDLRVSKDVDVPHKHAVRFSGTIFNLTNYFNVLEVHNNEADPLFGTFFGNHTRRFMADFDFPY